MWHQLRRVPQQTLELDLQTFEAPKKELNTATKRGIAFHADGSRKPGWMKAPNGKPTNLSERQWVQVRTPSFKRWFGDWENDPANASKVVDANGEPLVVYHGTRTTSRFDVFKGSEHFFSDNMEVADGFLNGNDFTLEINGDRYPVSRRDLENLSAVVYGDAADFKMLLDDFEAGDMPGVASREILSDITHNEYTAEALADFPLSIKAGGRLVTAFLNIRNPVEIDYGGETWQAGVVMPERDLQDNPQADGLIGRNIREGGLLGELRNGEDFPVANDYVVRDSRQIKSATENTGAFGAGNPDIRFSVGRVEDALKEMRPVETRRVASSYAEARMALAPQVGKTFRNKETGVEATLSNNSVNKLLSGKAVAKSVGVKEHLAAVANVTDLFENGLLLATDEGSRKGVLSAKRFFSRFRYKGEDLIAKTTVLEYERGDHRIYSVEAMEVEKAGSILAPKGSTNQAENPALPSTPRIVPQSGPSAQGGGARFSIGRLYTGSAADYERPSLVHVGSGEGSQVYGWGLYASDRRGVADHYARIVGDAKRRNVLLRGEEIDAALPFRKDVEAALKNLAPGGSPEDAAKRLEGRAADLRRRMAEGDGVGEKLRRMADRDEAAARWIRDNAKDLSVEESKSHVYEQTFFADRAPGDESHLLKWYEPVGEEQLGWILRQAAKEGLVKKFESEKKWKRFNGDFKEFITDDGWSAEAIYERLSESGLAHSDNKYRDTSEFLARAGIDGVKYPADSYGGKGVKDGDVAGWNYVSFRDDNIRVDHKWTDGQQRFSVARDLVDAMRKREIMQGIPVEGQVQPWPENFPKVMLQTTLASIKQKWPELHQRAKAGSDGAAIELVRNVLGEERIGKKVNPKWSKLRALADAHPQAIVAYVHAEEATGRNKIPATYARFISMISGLRVTDKIVQTVRANHTGANAVERMTRRAAFNGPVRRGAEYILVDDHVTQGGTLNELRKYIQSKGGKIVAVTTLTASQFSDTIPISRDATEALYAKFGSNIDEQLRQAGIANGVAELTQSQARELRKLRADTLRDRLAAARLDRIQQAHLRGVGIGLRSNDSVSGYTDLLPGFKDYYKPDGTPTETGTRWAKARQFQRAIGRELNSIIDEALLAEDLTPEETAQLLDRLIASAEATDEIRNGVLPNFRSDSSTDDPSVTLVGPDGRRQFTPERKAVQQQVYDKLMADAITGANNEALETRADGTAKEERLIVAANEGRPDLPPIPLQNPTYETRKGFRIDIIVGPPAAGKSSVFANALSTWYRSRVLDCDACKKGLPGFNNGNGANYVHAESSRLNKRMIYDIQHRVEDDPRRGENVVLPVLGDDVEGLRKKVREWKSAGYTVYLHNNRVPILHAFGRAILRTLATGRWINPLVIRACLDNPTSAYNEVKKEADYYDQFSNDVNIGEKPVWEDGNYLDPAYGDVRRLDGQDAERGETNGTGASGLLGRTGLVGRPTSRNGQYVLPGFERFSVATPSDALFPQLRLMSDDELVTAAVAVRMALGNGGKVSDRAVKVNTVNKMIRRLHPEYKTSDIGVESLRVISDARNFAKRIREDLDRGVSESLVLRHLPDTARGQFGREMDEEARRGQRLGRFGQKVAGALEERQARIVEDAVRVQTGMDVSLMENAYGINLSETLMHLAENPLTDRPPDRSGAAEGGESSGDAEPASDGREGQEISEAVKRAVDEIVSDSGQAARAYESNRADRRAADGRDGD